MERPEMQPLTWKDRWIILGMLLAVCAFWLLVTLAGYVLWIRR